MSTLSYNPLVSVIIPVFNAEKYIAKCVLSAINQTWHNLEIIIIDDGSSDESLKICKSFENDNIRIITQDNAGAASARNVGLQNSKGDYIQFLDSDDYLSENKIESQLRVLKNYTDHLGLCGTIYFYDDEDPADRLPIQTGFMKGSNDPVDFLIRLYGDNHIEYNFGGMIQPNAWLCPRKLIDLAGPWNSKISLDDDGEFFCRVILASSGIIFSQEGVNYYRKFKNSTSLSGNQTYDALRHWIISNKLKAKYLLSRTDEPRAKLVLSRLLWENCFVCYPRFKDLANDAAQHAKLLDPHFKYRPYNRGYRRILSTIFGWKAIKNASSVKHRLINPLF